MTTSKKRSFIQSDLIEIEPQTNNQQKAFNAFDKGKQLVLSGSAGSGKTFIALHMAFDEVLDKNTNYDKAIIVRSIVPSRDIGFLPGSQEEKIDIYKAPYRALCAELFEDKMAYNKLEKDGLIQFETTSFLRGLTFDNCIIIVDECQNLTGAELNTVITRIGESCKILICGDYHQSDLQRHNEKKGLLDFFRIIKNMESFAFVEFGWEDILRSDLVRDYIMTKEMLKRNDDFNIEW